MTFEPAPPLVTFDRLEKSYREGARTIQALPPVSGRFMAGESTALVGRSGSGKTTLLNLLSGIDRPDAGTAAIDGTEIIALSEEERTLFRRRHIGFIFQFFNLLPTLTVRENVRFPLELLATPRKEAEARVEDLLGRVGLQDRLDAFPDRLSGGERQRAAIARALAHRPRLLLADEPTGALDPETGEGVMALLVETVRKEGGALVLVTHSQRLARRADRVLFLSPHGLSPEESTA